MNKKLLFVRVFGIGNAVLSIPTIRHYRDNGFDVTVMVGTSPDDYGALEVLSHITGVRVITDVQFQSMPNDWDIVVLSIPYDGRYPRDIFHGQIVDGRPRPDPDTFGFSSWIFHEAEYQILTAERVTGVESDEYNRLCYRPEGVQYTDTPFYLDTSFWDGPVTTSDTVYMGIGRKYDQDGFWEKKHWGDENFIELAKMILIRHPEKKVVSTGNFQDLRGTGRVMIHALREFGERFRFLHFQSDPLHRSFEVLAGCHSYVGNDTGMMHVAASMGKPIVAAFNFEGTKRKNHPLCTRWSVLEGHTAPVTPQMMYDEWRNTCL